MCNMVYMQRFRWGLFINKIIIIIIIIIKLTKQNKKVYFYCQILYSNIQIIYLSLYRSEHTVQSFQCKIHF